MPPLIFYFPYPTAGGVSVLFLRLAKQLQEVTDITLVDLPNGFMARNCPSGVRLLDVSSADQMPPDGILITQTCPPWRLPFLATLPPNMRIFFWNLHPDNLNCSIIGGQSGLLMARILKPFNPIMNMGRKNKLSRFLRVALERRAIVFMDAMNAAKTAKSLGHAFTPKFLPICTDEPFKFWAYEHKATPTLRCVWLGRLEGFKISVLIHLLKRLDAIDNLSIQLNILGDGRDRRAIEDAASKLLRLKCNFNGVVQLDKIDAELLKCDVVFAMGTSALEGAKLGIPTFCVDYSYQPIKNLLRFRLISEVTGFNLGEEICPQHIEVFSTLESNLRNIMENPVVIGNQCFDYWRKYHSPKGVAKAFLDLAVNSELSIGKLHEMQLTNPDLLTRIRSSLYNPFPIDGWTYF